MNKKFGNAKRAYEISVAIKEGVAKELKSIEDRKNHPPYKVNLYHNPQAVGNNWWWGVLHNSFPQDSITGLPYTYKEGTASSEKSAMAAAESAIKQLSIPSISKQYLYMGDGSQVEKRG